jgi:PilZ domain-containing protein
MPDGWITDSQVLLKEVSRFAALKQRRRFERRKMPVAATVEVRGERFEGQIIDLSPGGARIRFDAPLAAGEELNVVLQELNQLGAQVVWRREGEAGVRFLLAPEEVAPRLEAVLTQEARARAAAKPPPAPLPEAAPVEEDAGLAGGVIAMLAAAGIACIAAVIGGGMMLAGPVAQAAARAPLAVTAGASEQHSCAALLGKVATSTNQVGFSLSVASAAQSKCLNLHVPGYDETDLNGHMVQATKLPVH